MEEPNFLPINDSDTGEGHEPLISPFKRNLVDRLFDPRKRSYRYCSLILISLLTFGPHFCFSMPAALQIQFQRDLELNSAQYSVFNSLSSWPNVLCFFSGTLIDRFFGIRKGALIFSIVLLVGQILFAFGAYNKVLWIMFVGRFLFGLL
jgi:MFS family permease